MASAPSSGASKEGELLPLLLSVVAVQIPIELGHHARLLEVLGPLLGVLTLQQPPLRWCLHRELHLALCLKVEEVGVFDLDRLPLIVIFDAEPVPQAAWTRRRGLAFVRRQRLIRLVRPEIHRVERNGRLLSIIVVKLVLLERHWARNLEH